MTETEHPCDSCIVITERITDELNPNEHCDGCPNEMRLIDYVPPDKRGDEYGRQRETSILA